MAEPIVLSSESQTIDGCDRVFLSDGRVIVQGRPVSVTDEPGFASVSVPAGETLNAVSAKVFLDAARELERRMGSL